MLMVTANPHSRSLMLHDAAFYAALFFIFGIAAGSAVNTLYAKWLLVGGAAIFIAGILYFLNLKKYTVFAIFLFLGAAYYFVYDIYQRPANLIFSQNVSIRGVITKIDPTENGQNAKVGNVRLYLPAYPKYEYGDEVMVSGKIDRPQDNFRDFFLKDGIAGTMRPAHINVVRKNAGSSIMAALLKLKNATRDNLAKVLPYEKSLFMSGLLLGTKAEFSKEFKNELSRSGTSHLVALSGYNITVVAGGLSFILAWFLSRRATFALSLMGLAFFVLMTGAEASVTRAALMGAAVLLAGQVERLYSFRNGITLVAAAMLIENPKILFFDIGFQLSFAALLGIVFLEPIVRRVLKLKDAAGFLNWRENLPVTVAAQLAVLPLLILRFGTISISGVISNILILGVIPTTMFLGFISALAGFFSYHLSLFLGYLANILLSYIMWVIKICSTFGYMSGITYLGIGFAVIYYASLVLVIYFNHARSE